MLGECIYMGNQFSLQLIYKRKLEFQRFSNIEFTPNIGFSDKESTLSYTLLCFRNTNLL